MGTWLGYRADTYKEIKHIPEFKSRQCFIEAGLRETWDKPKGIVWKVGYLKYIVMYQSEADRKYAGPKDGWEEDIRKFDMKYDATPCPVEWHLSPK